MNLSLRNSLKQPFVMAVLACTALLGAGSLALRALEPLANGRTIYVWNPSSPKAKRAMHEAETLAAIIERYRDEQGSLPESLSVLVPQHVDDIAPPSYGVPTWRYFPNVSKGTYMIGFSAEGGYPVAYYDSDRKRWYFDQ